MPETSRCYRARIRTTATSIHNSYAGARDLCASRRRFAGNRVLEAAEGPWREFSRGSLAKALILLSRRRGRQIPRLSPAVRFWDCSRGVETHGPTRVWYEIVAAVLLAPAR